MATWKTDQDDFGSESLSGSKLGNDIDKRDRGWLGRELLHCNGVTTETLANPMGVLELEWLFRVVSPYSKGSRSLLHHTNLLH